MTEDETNNNSLVPIHYTGLIKVGNIIKITDKVLKEYSERALAVFYKSVIIDYQEWMIENLNVVHFCNGDSIPEAKTNKEWIIAGKEERPAWCYYDNNPENAKIHGKLYNWYAVKDVRSLAPKGWHVPSDENWFALTTNLGHKDVGDKLKATDVWIENDKSTNESCFTAYPSGYRYKDGGFGGFGYEGYWWSSTENSKSSAWSRYMGYYHSEVYSKNDNKRIGCSVRCLKDYNFSY